MRVRAGFTLLEVLLAMTIMGLVAGATYYFYGRMQGGLFLAQTRAELSDEVRALLVDVRLAWRYRTRVPFPAAWGALPPPEYSSLVAGPFNPTGAAPCAGGLSILQKDLVTEAPRTITIVTTCRPPIGSQEAEKAHPDLNCPGGLSQVTITRTLAGVPTTIVYPRGRALAGAAVCFRTRTVGASTNISVEAGAVTDFRGETRASSDRVVLSTDDRSPGMEFLR